ncbi:MAG TPA: polymer-forming cytoskeletal protein [Bacteroidales bacterium]|nr:MAG: Polymer-forming cytoskeletal [Bacteroidetes bacterium ADurb.Bin037]HPV87858.1 polymer-forming cytoskeletal protein [Bacteroidales bacterium]HPW77891.1 polymer-forming cytoskeletal protein [Bacteroidales bacterium]HQB55349.1 polymer-forming cytoskeletal protein [Bacteroidales bacterium]
MATEKSNGSSLMNNVTRICGNTKIIGSIITQHDIRIDGYLEGKLKTDGKFVIGETGKCVGEAECKCVDISGNFDGVLKVSELASLRGKCIFTGELHSDQLSIEPSARINGQLISPELTKNSEKRSDEPSPVSEETPAMIRITKKK